MNRQAFSGAMLPGLSRRSSHTVPHSPLWNTSRRPTFSVGPSVSRNWPFAPLAGYSLLVSGPSSLPASSVPVAGVLVVVVVEAHLHLEPLAHVRRGKDVGLRGLPRDVRLVRHAVRVHPHPLVGVGVARVAVLRLRLAVSVRDAGGGRRLRVRPTCAAPEIAGLPAAGVLVVVPSATTVNIPDKP